MWCNHKFSARNKAAKRVGWGFGTKFEIDVCVCVCVGGWVGEGAGAGFCSMAVFSDSTLDLTSLKNFIIAKFIPFY